LLSRGIHVVKKLRSQPSPGRQEGDLASAIPAWARSQQLDLSGLQAGPNSALPCFLQGFCPKDESAVRGTELALTSAQVT